MARTLVSGLISRYWCPQTITTDQGRQFESQLLHIMSTGAANICPAQRFFIRPQTSSWSECIEL